MHFDDDAVGANSEFWRENSYQILFNNFYTRCPNKFSNLAKKSLNVTKSKKNKKKTSSKFVYILAKQCRSHPNLTNFKILISRRFLI